jgi:tetratricopeptide (TPR) repeat protein
MTLVRAVRTRGVAEAARLFREGRAEDPAFYREGDLNTLGYALINGDRPSEAVEILKLNAEAFPDSANVYDSLAEAYMASGDDTRAVLLYRKAIAAAAADKSTDRAFLERLVAGARRNAEKLERRIARRLGDAEARERYSRFTGNWDFDVPGFGPLAIQIFVADGLLWGRDEGGVLGARAEYVPVDGKPLAFQLDSPDQGLLDVEFVADARGDITESRFYLPSANIRGSGRKRAP